MPRPSRGTPSILRRFRCSETGFFYIPINGGAELRAKLRFEEPGIGAAEPDGPQAPKRISFPREPEVWKLLVAADIQRPDDNGPPFAARAAAL